MLKTINDIIPTWLAHKKKYTKESSWSLYLQIYYTHLRAYFGEHTVINNDKIQDYVMMKHESGLKTKSIGDHIIVLKCLFDFVYNANGCEVIPRITVQMPKEPKYTAGILSDKSYKLLINYAADNWTPRNMGILLAATTGLRIGELCALKWCDIDFDNRTINVQNTIQRIYVFAENDEGKRSSKIVTGSAKTGSSVRSVPIIPKVFALLKLQHKLVNPNTYILTNSQEPTEPRTFRVYYNKIMKSLGIPHITFHGLRHTFATKCMSSGMDAKILGSILGHANVITTLQTYYHPTLEQRATGMKKALGFI